MLLGTQRINSNGHLEIGGCDAVELAREFGTPLYVIDETLVRENCRAYKRAFQSRYSNADFAFAGKAFLTLAMCKILEQEGYSLDVASGGELFTALHAGFPKERIVLHGNNKSEDELRMGVETPVGRVVVDSLPEIALLASLAEKAGRVVDVHLRCTPGIDPHTHRRIRTGQEDSKFGLNIRDGKAIAGIKAIVARPELRLRGIHCHIGSQLLDLTAHREAIGIMVDFMKEIKDTVGVELEELNFGGGLGIRYLEEHQPPSTEEFAEMMVSTLTARLERNQLKAPRLMQEPGRSIVGEAGTTLYRIGVIKEVGIKEEPGKRVYVAIDGGLSDNPRPQLYDAVYQTIVANRAANPADQCVTIAGKHCETDILIWDTMVAEPKTGDVLAVQSTGAYNHSMANNYNRLCRPAAVLVADGRADLIIARERYEDLVRNDVIPERLR